MSVDIDEVEVGDEVVFEGERGIVKDIDYENNWLLVDFAPDEPHIRGEMSIDPDEPDLEMA